MTDPTTRPARRILAVVTILRERDKAAAMLAEVIRERDGLREKLERVRGLPRFVTGLGRAMWVEDDGDYVSWSDIAAILGEDGEA